MKVSAVSFKPCWRDSSGRWFSDGGFPRQMEAITALFDRADLLIVEVPPREGGIPLPRVNIVPLREPRGEDFRRKVSVVAMLPYYVREIARSVRSADVVHVPLPGDIPLVALAVAWICRRPVLARYGGSWAVTGETTLMNRVTRGILRMLALGRHVILATGDGTSRPAKGVDWIFSSALRKNEVAEIRPQLDRGLAAPARLVYVGRLSSEKGVAVLLRAMRLLREQNFPMPTLTLIGDGPERQRLEQQTIHLGLQDTVQFAGQLNRADLSSRLLDADLCVQPSLTEGFSKAWVDAMAHGLPVISSSVGAARAVIGSDGERGWLVPPGDESALASRLQSTIEDPLNWPALRRRCRAFAESRTIEDWQDRIGSLCAARWNLKFADGRLCR